MKVKSLSQGSKLVALCFAAALAVVQSLTLPTPAEAVLSSANYFLDIRGPRITGESTFAGYRNEIVLTAFTLSFSQPVTPATCGNLRVLKNVDKASPQLVLSAMLGRVHAQAVLSGVTQDGVAYFRMTLTNVVVLSVNISDTSGFPPAAEEVTLKAQSIVLEVTPENPNPTGAQVFSASIDCSPPN
jgi:type VI protein secretion system component Hcp